MRGRDDGSDFVFFDQDEPEVSLDLKHVVFVGDDDAVKFFTVLEANFVGEGASGSQAERGAEECKFCGDTHEKSIAPGLGWGKGCGVAGCGKGTGGIAANTVQRIESSGQRDEGGSRAVPIPLRAPS